MTIKTAQFVRKPFYVDGVQVTTENIQEVAEWCRGNIVTLADSSVNRGNQFIDVRVQRPLNPRQHQAYPGDWILSFNGQFKVYTPKAFEKSFDPVVAGHLHGKIDVEEAQEELKNVYGNSEEPRVDNVFEDQPDSPLEELLTVDEVAEETGLSTDEVVDQPKPGVTPILKFE